MTDDELELERQWLQLRLRAETDVMDAELWRERTNPDRVITELPGY
jgi:hypothetical protein